MGSAGRPGDHRGGPPGEHTLTVHHGKGKSARLVPISDRALGWIERYQHVRPTPADPEEAGVLFLSSKHQTFGLVCLSRKITAYLRAAGTTTAAVAAPPGSGTSCSTPHRTAPASREPARCWRRRAPWRTPSSSAPSGMKPGHGGGSSSTARIRRCFRRGPRGCKAPGGSPRSSCAWPGSSRTRGVAGRAGTGAAVFRGPARRPGRTSAAAATWRCSTTEAISCTSPCARPVSARQ